MKNLFEIIGPASAAILLLFSSTSFAGAPITYNLTSTVLDGSGTTSSNGSLRNISAAGQPGGISESTGGTIVNQAGFLQTFFIQSGKDTDGDGLADEVDTDNDNDTTADKTEIEGTAFSPNTSTDPNKRDTDGDGTPDNEEAVAGTDPTNNLAQLEIVSITNAAGNRFVGWVARSNKTYRLLRSDNALITPTNVIAVAPADGPALPPWFVLTNTIADAFPPTNASTYAVEVLP